MLVSLERRVAAGLDLEIPRHEVEWLLTGAFAQERLTGDVPVRHVARLVLAHGDPVPAKRAGLKDLRSIIHGNVVSPPRPTAPPPWRERAARTSSRRSGRWCPRRTARSSAARAPRRYPRRHGKRGRHRAERPAQPRVDRGAG